MFFCCPSREQLLSRLRLADLCIQEADNGEQSGKLTWSTSS